MSTKKTDTTKKDNSKKCDINIKIDSALKKWLYSFLCGIIAGLVFIFYAISYITNTTDVFNAPDADFTFTDGCTANNANLKKNVFTYNKTKYLNPETWAFWDYCLTQHKWYICNFDNAQSKSSGDSFERACQKLFPCAGGDGSGSMSNSEIITKLFRWPYLYQIVYSTFKNCFHASMSSGPNYFLFSKPLIHASNKGGLAGAANNIMFILQIFLLVIIGGLWILYSLFYCLISPIIKVNYAYVDFATAGLKFGYAFIFFMYLFFAGSGIMTSGISFMLLVILLFYHIHIHFIFRLFKDKTLLSNISKNVRQLLIAYTYWVAFCAIYSAMYYGPGKLFLYAVVLAVALLFYKFKHDLIPQF